VIKTIGRCEGAHQVDVDVGETALRDRNRLRADLKVAMDFQPVDAAYSLAQVVTSLLNPGQTNLDEMSP
jgi:hypothetical protein